MLAEGLDPLPGYTALEKSPDEASSYPLRFMSPKWNRYFVNLSHANQPRLLDAAGEPRLRIHPEDASKRGIDDGDHVRVFNSRGSVALRAELTDDMRPNIVIMLHGWWASRIGQRAHVRPAHGSRRRWKTPRLVGRRREDRLGGVLQLGPNLIDVARFEPRGEMP